MNLLVKIIFVFTDICNAYRDKYRLMYYKYLYDSNLVLGNNIGFGKDSAIVIHADGKESFLEIGPDTCFRRACLITLDRMGRLVIGPRNFFNNGCSLNCIGTIIIGEDNLFGENVRFYDHNHKFRNPKEKIRDQGFTVGSITIGNNCWIGSNCVILNNVTIGDNVIVGANVLIYKSIPSNTTVRLDSHTFSEKLYIE